MAPCDLDAKTKELIDLAVSVANGCYYCTASHTHFAKVKGVTEEQLAEMVEIVDLRWRAIATLFAEFYASDSVC